MTDERFAEEKMQWIESLFVKFGAVPTDLSQKSRALFDERMIYELNGNYIRTGTAEFDGEKFFLISMIDSRKFADVGLLEDVDALPFDLDEARMEQAVRYALGIDPYPEPYLGEGEQTLN